MKIIFLILLVSSKAFANDSIGDANRPNSSRIVFNCKLSLSKTMFQDFVLDLNTTNSDCKGCLLKIVADGESAIVVNGRTHIVGIQLFETYQSATRRYANISVTKLLANAGGHATPESIDSRNFEVLNFDNVNGSLRIPSTPGILNCKRF